MKIRYTPPAQLHLFSEPIISRIYPKYPHIQQQSEHLYQEVVASAQSYLRMELVSVNHSQRFLNLLPVLIYGSHMHYPTHRLARSICGRACRTSIQVTLKMRSADCDLYSSVLEVSNFSGKL